MRTTRYISFSFPLELNQFLDQKSQDTIFLVIIRGETQAVAPSPQNSSKRLNRTGVTLAISGAAGIALVLLIAGNSQQIDEAIQTNIPKVFPGL